ncbi:MAG: TetR family transcriptional regulator [Acidimicrobiia bacterium]
MTVSLRERKKAETREALASAALRLAVELGPDRVTVDEIAHAAGVSPRTFFNYFATKEDAILGNTSASAPRLLEQLIARPDDELPLDAIRAAMHASVDHLQADPDEWIARSRLVRKDPSLSIRYAARLAALERELVLEIARRTGLDADRDPYPGVIAGATMASARVALTIWQERGPKGSLSALLDQVFDQLAAGLPPPPRTP